MAQRIPVFRAARLVGVSRSTLQRKIREHGVPTFEGSVLATDLLALYPKLELGRDSEYERVQHIKTHAFARRVRDRMLPGREVLAERLAELGHELATTRVQLSRYRSVVEQTITRLRDIGGTPAAAEIHGLLRWIDGMLSEPSTPGDPLQELLAQDSVLRLMSAHIKIQPSNHEFWLDGNDSLLDAGVRAGLSLNYGCANGNCGLCKARLVSGEVKQIRHSDYVFSDAEKRMNYILQCACTAVSDVVLEALEAKDQNDIPIQDLATRVRKIEPLGDGLSLLHLQTPRANRFRFLAGQSASLSLPSGAAAELPIASCPCDDRNILFHIAHRPGDRFTDALTGSLRKGDQVIVQGPRGNFLLRENSGRRQIYLAFGTGFAPIKSLIEHAMALDDDASMYLYRWAPREDALYLHNLCRSWADALEDFHYQPVIAGDARDAVPALLDAQSTLEDCDVYLAGASGHVEDATRALLKAGLAAQRLSSSNVD